MKKFNFRLSNIFFGVLIVVIVIGGWRLRSFEYEKIPFPGQTLDEYSYTWVGMSLIQLGYPVGISGLPGYANTEYAYINPDKIFQMTNESGALVINYPWFDHPPGLPIVVGGWSYMKGARVFEDVSIGMIRKPMLVLSLIALILTMTVAGIVYDRWAMIVSGGLMMASPLVVIVGRLVQAENGFVVMYLGTVLMVALSMKIEKYRKVFWYLAAVIGSLGLWFKMTGIVSLVFLVFWGLRYGKMMALSYKEWMSPILGFGLISLGFWVIYGYVIDWNQFWLILQSNSGRVYGIGYEAIYNLITKGKVTNTVFLTDPIVFMGWLGWLILLFRWRGDNWKEGIVHLGICSYLIIYLFVGSYPYGWYHVPFYPFLMIGVGSLFSKLKYEKFNLLVLLILLWMTLGWLIELNVKYELRSLYVNIWKLLVVGSLGMGMMLVNARQKRWLSSALYLLLVAVIGMSVWRIYLVSGENWFRVG